MKNRKITKKYYFSVEGETEQWYLKWLQEMINSCETASCKVSFDCPIQKNPLKRAKAMNNTGKVEIWHLSDYESNENVHQKNYITFINRAYGEHFENMDEYKHEANFKRCLRKLGIQSVIDAIFRAKKIMEINRLNGYALHQYKGYNYYKENPSLMVWEIIEVILKDCELI